MKATFRFDLDDEDDAESFVVFTQSKKTLAALYGITDLLRSWDKYGIEDKFKDDSLQDVINILRSKVHDIIREHGVDL